MSNAASDIVNVLARELGRALAPLREATSSPEEFSALMLELGWSVDDIPLPIQALTSDIDQLVTALEAILDGGDSVSEFAALAQAIRDLVGSIQGLSSATFDPALAAAGFAGKFPEQLIQYLIVSYMSREHPRVRSTLVALGVIEAKIEDAPSADHIEHVRHALVWSHIPEVLVDPAKVFENVFGWRTDDFQAELVFQALTELGLARGLAVSLTELDSDLVEAVTEDDSAADRLELGLDLVLFRRAEPAGHLELGLRLLGLPKKGSELPGLALLPYVEGKLDKTLEVDDRLRLTLRSNLDVKGGVGFKLRPPADLQTITGFNDPSGVTAANGNLLVSLISQGTAGEPTLVLGSADGSKLTYGHLSLSGGLRLGNLDKPDLFTEVEVGDLRFELKTGSGDSFLTSILPEKGIGADFDLALGLSTAQGVYFRGSSALELNIPARIDLGPVELQSLTITARPEAGKLPIDVGTTVKGQLGPLAATVENVGLTADFEFPGQGGNLGPIDVSVSFKPPSGVGLSIDAGGLKGGGFLSFEPDKGRYVGAIELEFKDSIALKAIGLITTKMPDGSKGFSLLVIITSEFTPIQLGFGFTLNGVGGLLGLNRSVVVARLRTGVKDRTLESILFPKDIVANANRIISDLRQVFPPTRGQFLIGPMAKIGWGTPTLLTADLGLIIELPDPVRIAILGVVKTQLPDENSKILRLQVNFLGVLDFEQEMLSFDASLFDSKLLAFTLAGDMALRIKWGNDPNFLLSVGGFHPAYQPPPLALPTMARLSISLLGGSNPRISIETYFAITSNTVQFGAKAELYAGAGPFNVYGFIGFDVLFQFDPFYFNAALGAMLALRAGSSSIASISLAGSLEGPTPWKVKGKAKLKLFWFLTIKVKFSKEWGKSLDTRLDDIKVLPLLKAALGKAGNWQAELPGRSHLLVTLRQIESSADAIIAHPFGTLTISQKVVPLNLEIDKFGNRAPSDATKFSIESVTAGQGVSAVRLETRDVSEQFAPAQYLDMKDADRLSSKSFEEYDGGVKVVETETLRSGKYAMREVEYELDYIDSQRNLIRWPVLMPPDAIAFNAWSTQGAIAQSPLSSAKKSKPALAPDAVKVSQETYVVVNKRDLSTFDEQSTLPSEGAATSRLRELIRETPALARELEVVPAVRGPGMSDPIASYTFLPWLRQGMASQIVSVDTFGAASGVLLRAEVDVTLDVNGETVSNRVQLIGPGDIIGVNKNAIVRTEPRNWVTDFEPNYLAFIEFYDEDFVWRYTPARASPTDRLRPWLFLLALEEDDFEELRLPKAPVTGIRLKGPPSSLFPAADQTWAWAHVHVSKDVTDQRKRSVGQTTEALQSLIEANPDEASSRLLCPRKLKPLTAYHAFLIPAFETGRLTGLGQDPAAVDAQLPSWGAGQVDYPVYHRWYFRTSERGDFEYLVNLLEPRPVDDRVGIRDMDMTHGSFGVDGMTDPSVMGLEGALKKPGLVSRPQSWPPATTPPSLDQLEETVNLPHTLLEAGHPDPVVSPPLYGRWHAMVETMSVSGGGWVNELNRDPRLRVPAGYGTAVIQTGQEGFMRRAWQQLGDVLAANQKIRQAQLALAAGYRVLKRNLEPLQVGDLLAVTQLMHSRVRGSATTIAHQVARSRLTRAATHPAFRRLLRKRGPVMRKAVPQELRNTATLVEKIADGSVEAAPPKTAPAGQLDLSQLPQSRLPDWLLAVLRSRPVGWLVLALLVLLVAAAIITGAGVLAAGAVVVAVALVAKELLRRQLLRPGPLDENGFTPRAVARVPPNPGFTVTEPGEATPAATSAGTADSAEGARFRGAVTDLFDRLALELPTEAAPQSLSLATARSKVLAAIDPTTAIPKRVLSFVAIPGNVKYLKPFETIVPVMAHPVFPDPMYEGLRDISSELLMPNLNLIPNNTISLLETNRDFIESYMVGINHEMGRELLWRRYPTDHRGSYFRQFWDVGDMVNRDPTKTQAELEEELKDVTPLHEWGRTTALGTHENRDLPTGAEPGDARLVLVIRGDLLKKYPTAVIFAQKAKWIDTPDPTLFGPAKVRVLDESDPSKNLQHPIFKAQIDPDLKFLGFNLTRPIVDGSPDPEQNDPGWFFVIQERPGEPRFGLDIQDQTPPAPKEWNELAWNHLGDPATINYIDVNAALTTAINDEPDKSVIWGSNAADMGYILYQVPAMVAFHAADMLDES